MADIKYRDISKYKYEIEKDFCFNCGITGYEGSVSGGWVTIDLCGEITVKRGYCWDGCSGPTWDDETNIIPSAHHDPMYQLCRLGILPKQALIVADKLFVKLCRERGMNRFRAWYYFHGVNNWYVHKSHGGA